MTQHDRAKPDDRSDNVEKLQDIVQNTIGNMEAAEETLAFSNGKDKEAIQAKNERRKESIDGMRREIIDEASDRQSLKD